MAYVENAALVAARAQVPGYFRFQLGNWNVTALHDGVVVRDRPASFVSNASDEEVGAALQHIGLPADKLTITFTSFLVETDRGRVLLDTGFGESGPPTAGKLLSNLEAAGFRVDEVDTVIISHFHADHIMGLLNADGTLRFPSAEVIVPEEEWAYWTNKSVATKAPAGLQANFSTVGRIFADKLKRVRRVSWGEEFLPGFRSVAAPGHTPGHTAISIESNGDRMLYVADITNNPYLFARHPEWQAGFDMDGPQAVVTRRKFLDMGAAENMLLAFYHAPFPAAGYVIKQGAGYEFVLKMRV